MSEAKCGTCKHWVDGGPDPNHVGAPHPGECREGPPGWQMLPLRMPTGPSAVEVQVHYPPVPENFPACSRHEVRGDG